MAMERRTTNKLHIAGTVLNFLSFGGIIIILAFIMQIGQYKEKIDGAVKNLSDLTMEHRIYAVENTKAHEDLKNDIDQIKIFLASSGKRVK